MKGMVTRKGLAWPYQLSAGLELRSLEACGWGRRQAMTNYKELGDCVGKAYGQGNSKPRPGVPALNKRPQPGKYTRGLAYQ